MKIYLVGGAVRDKLLGIPCREKDWVVTGATPEDMLATGYQQLRGDFPVFIHPRSGDEYALARRETKVGAGYHGFEVDAAAHITLEEDLKRRDLTINAMALDENGNLIDPYHGRDDLDAGLLRHVSQAFSEDPVRLLRVARFAAKLGRWGFSVAHGTHGLMKKMAAADDLLALRPQRIWKEMSRALMETQPWRFFEVLDRCGALQRLLPGIAKGMSKAGPHGVAAGSQSFPALRRAVAGNAVLEVRYALLMLNNRQDVLPASKACTDLLQSIRELDDSYPPLSTAPALLGLIERGCRGGQDRLQTLLRVYEYRWPECAAGLSQRVRTARQAVAAVTAEELMREGLRGPALGEALRERRLQTVQRALG